MYISYFDETGDDGYPKYSSELFVLTSIYVHFQKWKEIYQKIYSFREQLKINYGLPIKEEIHTKHLLLNKGKYKKLNLSNNIRLKLLSDFAGFIGSLEVKSISVCINKTKINSQNIKQYKNILDTALSFNIQRIENTLGKINSDSKFLIISDEGRIGAMKQTSRRIQKVNFIPSKIYPSSYRKEINQLIEDPLPKNSKDSYFIQIADFISYFVYLYHIDKSKWHGRLSWFMLNDLKEIIDKLNPIFNQQASQNKYGFVCYPK